MNDDAFDYVLNFLSPDEQRRLRERLRADPQLRRRVELWERAVAPLAADRDCPSPPAGLAARTMQRIDDYRLLHESNVAIVEQAVDISADRLQSLVRVMDRSTTPASRFRRWDMIAVAVIVLVGVGLLLSGVPYLRHRQAILACQDQMRQLYQGLETYASVHEGRYPQVREQPPFHTAGSMSQLLSESGVLPAATTFTCPAAGSHSQSTYAYTLGFRDESGNLMGMCRDGETTDLLPVVADRPLTRIGNGVSREHRYGQNVLFLSGQVRFCTTTQAGVGRDEIYLNQIHRVAAGMHRNDTVLGVDRDQP